MEEKTKKIRQNKLENYFLNVIRTDLFQKTIKELRKNYKIPEGGFKINDDSCLSLVSTEKITDIIQELNSLCTKINLPDWYWIDSSLDYLFFNRVDFSNNISKPTPDNLCQISDVGGGTDDFKGGKMGEIVEKYLNKKYPIVLRISPYASERDILNFIKENNETIKFLQREYGDKNSKIGRIRTKNQKKQERNDFIYEHRHLPLKKIFKLVSEKFDEVLDDGLIGKIKSVEAKRRKEV
jgi:hypothetical protein